jgi:hypothetical protein
MEAMTRGSQRRAQTLERTNGRSGARALSASARAVAYLIGATGLSIFSASTKGWASNCGSAAHDSRKGHPCSKGESSEWESDEAGAADAEG